MSFALFESLTEVWVGQYLRLCLVAVKRFPEKENVSMCLVAFQKIFRKIFSGVWKRRRKTQIQKNTSHNPEKNHQRRQIQSDDRAVDCDLAFFARSRSRLGLELELRLELAISDWSWSSRLRLDLLLSRARARFLSLSHFPEML